MLQIECQNAGIPKKVQTGIIILPLIFLRLFRHRHSGIVVSPVPLVTD
jgi:hypothetical protein